jgi:hypothetical protein
MEKIHLLLLFILLPVLLNAQVFWAAGYTEDLDTLTNGQILIQPMPDTVLVSDFDSPVQFESTMAGVYDDDGQIIFYTNGCHLYDRNHQIIPGGENLNPGEIHDMVCDQYGYIAPKGATILQFRTQPHLYFLLHVGIQNSISHSVSYGPLYLTQIAYDPETETTTVLSKNEVLIEEEIDPFEVVRHGNGDDWWVITNRFGTATYHKILLSPEGVELHELQQVGYKFPFPPCRWQRSLVASPSGSKLVRFSSKCGAQYLTFDRCSGTLEDFGFSHLDFNVYGGGGAVFSENELYVYFSRWYQVAKVQFTNPLDTLKSSFTPPLGFGGSFVHTYRDPYGRIYFHPQASECYLHLIEPGDNQPDTAMVRFEGLQLPKRIQRTMPHYPNYELGPLVNSDCDTLMISSIKDEILNLGELKLYPNPAFEEITIDVGWEGAKTIILVNALGVVVKEINTTAKQINIDVSYLPKGIYFTKVLEQDQLRGSMKWIKL